MAHSSANRAGLDQTDPALPSAAGTDAVLPEPLPPGPFALFKQWFDQAQARKAQPNPNAFSLATVNREGRPAARIVLCKGIDLASGHIIFYTNYRGRKAKDLDANPRAAACFHWDHLDKQARLEGSVAKSPAAESDAYFASRPWLSRLGAWVSDQSEPIASREELRKKLDAMYRRFGIDPASLPPPDARVEIPRPPHWGGYRLYAERVELWCSGEGRLHDRAAWTRPLQTRAGDPGDPPTFTAIGPWTATRLQP